MLGRFYSRKVAMIKFIVLFFLLPPQAYAIFFTQKFPKPVIVVDQMRFWLRIFDKYDATTTVIHDTRQLNLVLDVIDFRNSKYPRGLSWKKRQKISQQYVLRYRKALKRFRKYRLQARKFGAIERRVYQVYRQDVARLLQGEVQVRSQSGLRDTYIRAIHRAEPFMVYMKRIFSRHQVPVELVSLAFVESMFNYKARSKVGAAGVWQFMPSTAKEFLHLNSLVDERISPLKATKAAAKLLRRNYRRFRSWPLAITAYNQGFGNISRAVKKLKTKDIGVIIQKYKSGSFGFAGRNFYSEFLAADKVYNYLMTRKNKKSPPLSLVSLRLPKKVSTARLIRKTSLDKDTLGKYNPCFSSKAFTSKRNVKLPLYYEIFVPQKLATKVKSEVRRI